MRSFTTRAPPLWHSSPPASVETTRAANGFVLNGVPLTCADASAGPTISGFDTRRNRP